MSFIDKDEVKAAVSFKDAAEFLELSLKREGDGWRAACPACGEDEKGRSIFSSSPSAYFCHRENKGGDVIALVMHVYGVSFKEALRSLAEWAGIGGTGNTRTSRTGTSTAKTVPESERARPKPQSRSPRGGGKNTPSPQPNRFDPEKYAASLDYEHELLVEAGADLEKMQAIGIGFSKRGTHQGMLVIRVQDADGEVSFVGIEGTIHLPPSLRSNVVPLRKRA